MLKYRWLLWIGLCCLITTGSWQKDSPWQEKKFVGTWQVEACLLERKIAHSHRQRWRIRLEALAGQKLHGSAPLWVSYWGPAFIPGQCFKGELVW